MNDDELRKQLDRLSVPAPEEGAKERAWFRAEQAFRNSDAHAESVDHPRRAPWLAVAAAACVVIVSAFVLGRWSADAKPNSDLQLLGELQRMFPQQLQAIVRTGDQTEILTTPDATTFSGQPLVVELHEQGKSLRIVSFSGQRIATRFNGRPIDLEFLVTPEGAILIAGKSFVWRSDHAEIVDGYKIEARTLTAGL